MSRMLKGVKEIMNYFRLSESTVMDMIMYKGLPAKKVDGSWQISEAEADAYMHPPRPKAEKAPAKARKPAAKAAKGGKSGSKK